MTAPTLIGSDHGMICTDPGFPKGLEVGILCYYQYFAYSVSFRENSKFTLISDIRF